MAVYRQQRRLDDESRAFVSGVMFIVNTAGLLGSLVAQILNTLGVWFHSGPGVYFLGLVFFLFVAAYVFARMVTMRPGK